MRYVKFSALVSFEQLDDAWNLRASRQFLEAGYGDVAWKITPVADDDPTAKDTTCSIPNDFFQTWRGDQDGAQDVPLSEPPESFGSDEFWQWFDEYVDGPPVGERGEGDAAVLEAFVHWEWFAYHLRFVPSNARRAREVG